MMERHEIVLSGYGGQGVVLGGIILAEAAAVYDGLHATHNQSYGPEARGGASKSEVIISKGVIHYPEIEHPDILVALNQEAADKYGPDLKENGIFIVDSGCNPAKTKKKVKFFILPMVGTAIKIAGSEMVTNIVALGALAAVTKVVSRGALEKAILSYVPKGTEELNLRAMNSGFEIPGQPV
ncbi:MAG: 2-oxoacid:acceptor oxidoreductase family protein [Firmicutes bacterium]|nr:2-oxoacid:acceptor oxidoreductase family protein [Bacillota bacterium]